jgi:integrase/recombinase XerD
MSVLKKHKETWMKDVEAFLDYLEVERKFSNHTLAAYHTDLEQFHTFLKGERAFHGWDRVKREDILAFILLMKEKKYASSTITRRISAIRSFFSYLQREGKIKSDPSEEVELPKVARKLPRVLTVEEMDELLELPGRSDTPIALRDRAMLELAYASGMRVSELVALKMADLSIATGEIRCIGKGNRERVIPLSATAVQAIQEYLDLGRPHLARTAQQDYLFLNRRGRPMTRQGFWLMLKRYAEEIGLYDITPHTLRHTFATHALQRKVNLRAVQEVLGHASIATTQVYTHLVTGQLHEAFDEAHPRAEE